ncbi:hypothetical protein SAMN05444285_10983 [Draconibacterium orientale]|uniref:Pectate lyase superfamily protein n=1 Tax=Draconibacterium orientale TaxID=1168034 RepID=X5E2P6_9BACT|nr:hypothetical protein [Draconibacterium orientale]AHW61730.1 hypothetical protein FH5T_07230 [Draconibacterium orientale]SET28518.1 hypothetical protein SAMN05444285_10983 [Draconibacterium orientale]
MKKLYFLPFLFLAITTFAQKQFVVQNGTAQTFDEINAAIEAASAGDTIYLPGGGFSISAQVDKTLHWRGVGHYPDSTSATGFTQILGSPTFSGNCDNSTFEGIFFQSSVTFGSNDNECTGVIIKRCRVNSTLTLRTTTDVSSGYPNLNVQVFESVLAHIDANNGMNIRFEKNLIFGLMYDFYQSSFNHNSFNVNHSSMVRNCKNCQFTNNVFSYHATFDGGTTNCNFENNIFQQSGMPFNSTTSTFTSSGNIYNTGLGLYVSIVGNNYTFDYANDYNLNDITGTAEDGTTGVSIKNSGIDGTDPGVYGTSLPYKEGAVPYAPHIQSANIVNDAVNGELGVQIKVVAQER